MRRWATGILFCSIVFAKENPRAILDHVARVYRDAQSYDIQADIASGEHKDLIEIAWSAPDLLRVENKSRGETTVFLERGMSEHSAHANVFIAPSAPSSNPGFQPNTEQRRIAAIAKAGYAWYPRIEAGMTRAHLLRDETVDLEGSPVDCAVIEVSYAHNVRRTYWVDTARGFVLREIDSSPGRQDRTITVRKLIWNQPLPPSLFAFDPPSAYSHLGPNGMITARPISVCRQAEYTPEARFAHLAGSIYVEFTIDEQGRPSRIHATNSLGLGLDERALGCVEQSRYEPATKNGTPFTVPSGQLVSFNELPQFDWSLGRVAFELADGVTPPSFKKVDYPPRVGDRKAFTVPLRLVIDAQGVPRDIQAAGSVDPKLTRQAEQIVRGWRFTPGERNGQPAAVAASFDLVHGPLRVSVIKTR